MSEDSEVGGASRRDVIKGSAIGVGALLGGLALVNSNEVSADATTPAHRYTLGLSGITGSTPIALTSLSFGGDNQNGSLTPEQVSLTGATGRFSPLILQAFVNKTPHTATIRGYQPNASGVEVNSVTITCTGAEILRYHLSVSSAGAPVDNIHLSFTSIDLNWVLQNVHFTWTPPV